MLNTRIHAFTEPVPVCVYTTQLSSAITLLHQQDAQRLVILNAQNQPLGLVYLADLLLYASPIGGNGSDGLTDRAAIDLLHPSILRELPSLAADTRLSECPEALQETSARFWAVTSSDQQFLGLIDSFYLRKLLELSIPPSQKQRGKPPAPTVTSFSPNKSPGSKNVSESLWHQVKTEGSTPEASPGTAEALRLKKRLQLQISERQFAAVKPRSAPIHTHPLPPPLLPIPTGEPEAHSEARVSSLTNVLTDVSSAISWLPLIDWFPLPLMIQTDRGKTIGLNQSWIEQFGELDTWRWVSEAGTDSTDNRSAQPRSTPQSEVHPPLAISSQSDPIFCQAETPNHYLCAYAAGGSHGERTLRMVRMPLPTAWATSGATSGLPAGSAEAPPLWLVLGQDVTDQEQLARELTAKNADLVQLNRLKDEFLACISHELRTPLTAVLGLSSLLKDQLADSMSERHIRYAQLIHRSGRHLMQIVNDILDLIRIETGQLDLNYQPVRIKALCDRVLEQAQQLCRESPKTDLQADPNASTLLSTCTYDIEPGLGTLMADETRLRQILVNLLSNAFKFTEPTKPIGLRVTRWEGWIAFTVWDQGIGIPATKQHLIFQKFQQLENPMIRRFEGIGLGLVIAQRLARLHGGEISFVSQEEQGSQFTLLIPPTPAQPTQTISQPRGSSFHTPAAPPRNRLILVVEAVVKTIDSLTEQLHSLGYRSVIARSGPEAVEKARRLQPLTILLNPLLPTLSGWDVLTLLKAEPETQQIPVVMMATRGEHGKAYRHQADSFLSLPVSLSALRNALMQIADASQRVSPEQPPVLSHHQAPIGTLVILRLSPTRYGQMPRDNPSAPNSDSATEFNLNALLHSHNYRVLEADDLEQADLLAQVWKPHIVLLDTTIPEPISYLKRLGEQTFLASLPLVTLDLATTQAANQIPGLSVFPCLAAPQSHLPSSPSPSSAAITDASPTAMLLQVIEIAAGFAWRPFVLVMDTASLVAAAAESGESLQHTSSLQALVQYLQTAGFRSGMARSWVEGMNKLKYEGVDLLLLYLPQQLTPKTMATLWGLQQIPNHPPIVAVAHPGDKIYQDPVFTQQLHQLATLVLPSMPMEELLAQVNRLLKDRSE